MGQTPVNSMVGVHERSVIDSRYSRHRGKSLGFLGHDGRPCHCVWLPDRSFCPAWYRSGGDRSGVSPHPLPKFLKRAFFGRIRMVLSMRYGFTGLVPVAKGSAEVIGVWPGLIRSLRGLFLCGKGGKEWRGGLLTVFPHFAQAMNAHTSMNL